LKTILNFLNAGVSQLVYFLYRKEL
jgi:hypothetical protein